MSQPAAESRDMINLTIDGKGVSVPKGTTIIEAAGKNGIFIPRLCYLKKLRPIGSCRICSVEIDGVDSPQMSCATPVSEGMRVTTKGEKLEKYRQDMMRFILVNHPLYCPQCERSGECSLQDRTYELGVKGHAWATSTHESKPVVDWGLIQYDQNLCIMCERCVRICREVQGVAAYRFDGAGYDAKVNTVTGEKLDCDFCGQCINVCPVGALSSGIYFSARSWEMRKTETICPHCGVGCTLLLNTKNENVVRVTVNDHIGNNRGNLCSRGKFGYEFIQSGDRIKQPLVRENGELKAVDWDTALGLIAGKLAPHKGNRNAFGGIGSERATNEDNFVFQKFFREVLGSGNLDNISNMEGASTASAIYDDFSDFPMTCSFDELKAGNLFIFIGADGSNENPVLSNHVREAILDHSAEVVLAYSREATFLPPPAMRFTYDYVGMNGFVLGMLHEVAGEIRKKGTLDGGVPLDENFAGKLSPVTDGTVKGQLSGLATLIRKKGKPVYIVGLEAQRHPQSAAIVRNIVNLARLTGGRIVLTREYSNSRGVNDMGVAPNKLPGYAREARAELSCDRPLLDLMDGMKVLMVMDEDVLLRHHDWEKMKNALRKAEFVVMTDQFYNHSCDEADVILPSCTSAEKDGTFTNLEGRVQKVRKAVEPVGQSRPAWKIFADLAERMGSPMPYSGSEDVTKDISSSVPAYAASGGGAFFVDFGGAAGDRSLKWVEPKPVAYAPKDGALMVMPDVSLYALGLYTEHCPSLKHLVRKEYPGAEAKGEPDVAISPSDAERFGVGDGDGIRFKHTEGEWKGKVRIDGGVRPGTVRIPWDKFTAPLEKISVNGKDIEAYNVANLKG